MSRGPWKVRPTSPKREAALAALRAQPDANARLLAQELGCSMRCIDDARAHLVTLGEIPPRRNSRPRESASTAVVTMIADENDDDEGAEDIDIPETRLVVALEAVLPHATGEQLAAVMLALLEVVEAVVHEAPEVE